MTYLEGYSVELLQAQRRVGNTVEDLAVGVATRTQIQGNVVWRETSFSVRLRTGMHLLYGRFHVGIGRKDGMQSRDLEQLVETLI